MNYEPNTIRWNPGDIVIHDADNKSPHMLMMVVGYLKDGRCETRYLNPRTTTMQRRFANRLDVLHDPKRFEIDVDYVPISALTDVSNWKSKPQNFYNLQIEIPESEMKDCPALFVARVLMRFADRLNNLGVLYKDCGLEGDDTDEVGRARLDR